MHAEEEEYLLLLRISNNNSSGFLQDIWFDLGASHACGSGCKSCLWTYDVQGSMCRCDVGRGGEAQTCLAAERSGGDCAGQRHAGNVRGGDGGRGQHESEAAVTQWLKPGECVI
jgi:hypothetical protein